MLVASQAVFSQEKAAVDYRAIQTRLVKIDGENVVKLVGDVFLVHNGAIISCDTAYRYSERRFEAFGNVIINQDSLYVYGDKVIYNGETDEAEVISELIKVVDGDVTMYTREMFFNTKESVGRFDKGATMRQQGNLMESFKGSYNTKTKLINLDTNVAMENEEYILKTQQLDYDQNTALAKFYSLVNIWNTKGEYLQSDKGKYDNENSIYHFEKNSYILTADQECWADSIIYYSNINEVELRRDIQIVDTVKSVSSFGDYGYLWSKSNSVLMTKNPSVFSCNELGQDSSFVSSDTITVKPFLMKTNAVEEGDKKAIIGGVLDSLRVADSLRVKMMSELGDSLEFSEELLKVAIDKELHAKYGRDLNPIIEEQEQAGELLVDILQNRSEELLQAADTIANNPLTELEEILEDDKPIVDSDTATKYNLPTYSPRYSEGELEAMSAKEKRKALKLIKRDKKRFDRELIRFKRDNAYIEKLEQEKAEADSLANQSLNIDTLQTDTSAVEVANVADSSDVKITAFGNAKVYKLDMQSVADTIVVESVDSTTTSIGSPIVWNGMNQITALRVRSYIKNGEMTRTRMFGDPIMSQLIEGEMFNQMKGDYMDALYRDNVMYRLVVTGNALGRMYREEIDKTSDVVQVVAFVTSKSKNMIIDMANNLISRVKWVGDTETATYPMEILPKKELYLEGFTWVPELRPAKRDVFNRVIRPSERAQMMLVAKPSFSITKQIMDDRVRLIREGVWTDRNDKLKIDRAVLLRQAASRNE